MANNSDNSKKSFLFNGDWYETLREFSDDVRLEVYEAAIRYALSGTLTEELRPLAKMAFSFIKREIDFNTERYNDIINKRREAGRQGGKGYRPSVDGGAAPEEGAQEEPNSDDANQANASKSKQTQANASKRKHI